MKTALHARTLRPGARILATYLITLSITAPLFAQSNPCAEPFKYLKEGIYNRYKETTSLQRYSSMKDYFKSEDFKQDVKKGGWGVGIKIPIKGIPISLNASSSKDDFAEFRSGIEKLSENQLIEAFGQNIEKSEPNTDFVKQYFQCLKDNAQGFTWTAERIGKRAYITIRFMPLSMTDPMPVITEDLIVDNASDILAPKKGQPVDLSNVISAVVKDPEQSVTVTMVTNKKTVYASSDPQPTATPPPSPTATSTASPKKQSFEVLGVRHKDKTVGKYFGFKAEDLDAILGREGWDDTLISVSKKANGPFRQARVWRSSNGTAGTAHGRYETGWHQGDWTKGDVVYVQPDSR